MNLKKLFTFIHMITPSNGVLLIAEPFLKDASFMRSVVLICKHNEEEGTFGFSIHRKLHTTLDNLFADMKGFKIPVYLGGPVQTDTLHYIHKYPQLFSDAVEISENVYWGGDFELMKKYIKEGAVDVNNVKFFLGYSGWSAGQLEEEIKENSWITLKANEQLIFHTAPQDVWQLSLTALGGKYKMMIHLPTDPQLN
jgi:putative transcriptional regulator